MEGTLWPVRAYVFARKLFGSLGLCAAMAAG